MQFTPEEIERAWRDAHRAFAAELVLSMPASETASGARPAAPLDERLVQAIWSDQLVRSADLATASGKAIQVIEPGRWNTGRGPDFLDARLVIAGETHQGDVEIHIESADWHRHAHDRDFEYNRTVLHVVLHASDDRPYEQKQNGDRLERLPALETDKQFGFDRIRP